jgi:hypothetical protein
MQLSKKQLNLLYQQQQQASGAVNPIPGLSPAAYFKFNTGITVTGLGVSQWDDQSGNSRHLLQGTDANRPSKEADGSILFNGTAHFLKCSAFTLNQPETVAILYKSISWTDNDRIFDGNANDAGVYYQETATPNTSIYAGAAVVNADPDIAIGSYGVALVQFSGATSSIAINGGVAVTGNAGASNMGGFALGAKADGTVNGNIQVKEAAIFPAVLSAGERASVAAYLMALGGVS